MSRPPAHHHNWAAPGRERQAQSANVDEAREALNADDSVKISDWTHGNAGRVEYLSKPTTETPFLVRTPATSLSVAEEGRYEERTEEVRTER